MERSEPKPMMMEFLKRSEQEREREIRLEQEEMGRMEQVVLKMIESIEQERLEVEEWLMAEGMGQKTMMEYMVRMMQNMTVRMKKIEEMSECTKRPMMKTTMGQMMDGLERRIQRMRHSLMILVEADISGATALHTEVRGGNMEVVEWLVRVNPVLANIEDMNGTLPVHLAARLGKREMVELLLRYNTKIADYESIHKLWHSMVYGGLYDMALTLLGDHPKLASVEPSPLMELIAQNNILFPSGTHLNFLQRLIYSGIPLRLEDTTDRLQERDIENQNPANSVVPPLVDVSVRQKLKALFWDVAEKLVPWIESVRRTKLVHHQASKLVKCLCQRVVETDFPKAPKIFTEPLFAAAPLGIHAMVKEILESFPAAIHMMNEKNRSLFHITIKYRQPNVYGLIKRVAGDEGAILMSVPDVWGNNALHLAGKLGMKQQLSIQKRFDGPVLQMHAESSLFKNVGRVILPQAKECRNIHGRTPEDLFIATHEQLDRNREDWMKNTGTSCSVVAVLVATVAFAAAITVPGGSDDKSGSAKKLGDVAFDVFGVANAGALIASSASLLIFLSTQIGHYRQPNLQNNIPYRMACGLLALFFAVVCLTVAFCGAFMTVFGGVGERKMLLMSDLVGLVSVLPNTLFMYSLYWSLSTTIKTIFKLYRCWQTWK